ncbi:MAG: M14 metallopeptidase family protein [Chitinophagaceae bacterium]
MRKFSVFFSGFFLLLASFASAQNLPSPKEFFGFNIGDDYQLANFTKMDAYFQKLAASSDRIKMVDIGVTEEGRPHRMVILSSPENIRKLDHYKDISQKMALARGISEEQAKALANEGKAVVWIDGGIHSNEVVGMQQLIETTWQFASRKDPETMRILDNVIILFNQANPDGQELVSNWYMTPTDTLKRNMNIPRLYQKYIGHDDNRDYYMMNMKETNNLNRQMFIEWMPQIMYNHHQAGPAGSVVAGPPYRDPFNYVFDPLMITSIDALGAAMYNRLNFENKPGLTRLTGSTFSTWYNGGLRTTTQFHNMVGLLTEIIGNPTPSSVPLVPDRLVPNGATPNPVTPQQWHFRQSIDYSVSLNYAVLDYAARQRDQVLLNMYRMGKNSIERGSHDYWTLSPKRADSIKALYQKDQRAPAAVNADDASDESIRFQAALRGMPLKYFDAVLKNPTLRDPRGYIITADQKDLETSIKFLNALIKAGIFVNKSTADFTVNGKKYPAGSYVIKTAQAFRPHILDMFEPQDHPNDFQYPGGPPIRPYDAAGWTLAYQMGVQFDRVLEDFTGPFQELPFGQVIAPELHPVPAAGKAGYLVSTYANNSFTAVNDLVKAGVGVFRVSKGTTSDPQGTFFVPAGSAAAASLAKSNASAGIEITPAAKRPAGLGKLTPLRIGLWDTYGGSIASGWIRWILEQYHFPFTVIYPKEIDAGDLKKKYDVLIFVAGSIPAVPRLAAGGGGRGGGGFGGGSREEDVPAEFRPWLGRLTADTSIRQLKKFMEDGGSVLTIGSATSLAYHLKLPVTNFLVEKGPNGTDRPLPGTKYFIPGSILKVSYDTTQESLWGMPAEGDVNFDNSPVFKVDAASSTGAITPLAWFSSDKPLRSGWAFGQSYLKDGIAAFVAPVGKGKLFAFGPDITFRGQAHSTFKLLFNQLYSTGSSTTKK